MCEITTRLSTCITSLEEASRTSPLSLPQRAKIDLDGIERLCSNLAVARERRGESIGGAIEAKHSSVCRAGSTSQHARRPRVGRRRACRRDLDAPCSGRAPHSKSPEAASRRRPRARPPRRAHVAIRRGPEPECPRPSEARVRREGPTLLGRSCRDETADPALHRGPWPRGHGAGQGAGASRACLPRFDPCGAEASSTGLRTWLASARPRRKGSTGARSRTIVRALRSSRRSRVLLLHVARGAGGQARDLRGACHSPRAATGPRAIRPRAIRPTLTPTGRRVPYLAVVTPAAGEAEIAGEAHAGPSNDEPAALADQQFVSLMRCVSQRHQVRVVVSAAGRRPPVTPSSSSSESLAVRGLACIASSASTSWASVTVMSFLIAAAWSALTASSWLLAVLRVALIDSSWRRTLRMVFMVSPIAPAVP